MPLPQRLEMSASRNDDVSSVTSPDTRYVCFGVLPRYTQSHYRLEMQFDRDVILETNVRLHWSSNHCQNRNLESRSKPRLELSQTVYEIVKFCLAILR